MTQDADDVAPSQPFSQGHKRSPEVTAELVSALSKALYARPDWRLGQLLTIVAGGRDLWNVWDETWVKALDAELIDGGDALVTRRGPQQDGQPQE